MSKDVVEILIWVFISSFVVVFALLFAASTANPPANQFGNAPEECARQYHSLSPEEKAWWSGSEDYINACVQ